MPDDGVAAQSRRTASRRGRNMLKVLDGHRSTEDARRALIEAAKESDVLAPEETRH